MIAEASTPDIQPRSLLATFSIVMLALMCVVPFLSPHHYPPIATFYNEWLAALLGLAAAIFLLRKPATEFVFPVIALLPLGLIMVLGIQIAAGKALYWQNHYLIMLYLGLTVLMMILGANLRRHAGLTQIVPTLAWAVIAGGVISMLIILLAKIGLAEKAPWSFFIRDHAASHVGQINHLANYLALGLASILYLFLNGHLKRLTMTALALVFVLGLAHTGQRMAVLYIFLLAIMGWGLAMYCNDKTVTSKAKQLFWLLPMFIVAELTIPLMSFLDVSSTPMDRVVATMGRESVRLTYIQQAWQLFLQSPLLGAGWGEFGWNNFIVTEHYPAQRGLTHHAHNLILHLLAEMGLVGAVICCMGVVLWLLKQFKVTMTLEKWWIVMLLAVIGTHSMLEYPLWFAYFLLLSALLFGLGDERVIVKEVRLMPLISVMVLVFGGWNLVSIQQHYSKIESTLTTFRESPDATADTSAALTGLYEMRPQTVLTPYVDNLLIRLLPNLPELREDKLIINEKVTRFWPGMAETYTHATLLALNYRPQEAVEMMKKAIKQFPQFQERFRPVLLQQIYRGDQELRPLLLMLEPQASNDKKL